MDIYLYKYDDLDDLDDLGGLYYYDDYDYDDLCYNYHYN